MKLDPRSGIFLWLLLAEMQTVLATWSRYCTPFIKSLGPHPRGICGNNLNDMLSLLCYNGYNRKRRDTYSKNNLLEREGILIPREDANSYLAKRSAYYEQGIVCECCYNRCNLRELRGYCRNDSPGRFGLFKRSIEGQIIGVENPTTNVDDTNKSVYDTNRSVEDTKKSVEDTNKSLGDTIKGVEDSNRSVVNTNRSVEDTIKRVVDHISGEHNPIKSVTDDIASVPNPIKSIQANYYNVDHQSCSVKHHSPSCAEHHSASIDDQIKLKIHELLSRHKRIDNDLGSND